MAAGESVASVSGYTRMLIVHICDLGDRYLEIASRRTDLTVPGDRRVANLRIHVSISTIDIPRSNIDTATTGSSVNLAAILAFA